MCLTSSEGEIEPTVGAVSIGECLVLGKHARSETHSTGSDLYTSVTVTKLTFFLHFKCLKILCFTDPDDVTAGSGENDVGVMTGSFVLVPS